MDGVLPPGYGRVIADTAVPMGKVYVFASPPETCDVTGCPKGDCYACLANAEVARVFDDLFARMTRPKE